MLFTRFLSTNNNYKNMFFSCSGISARNLKIKPHTLEKGTWYLVSLTVTQNSTSKGPAYYEFLTNRPPEGGTCRVLPYDEKLDPIGIELISSDDDAGRSYMTMCARAVSLILILAL